MDLAQNWRSAVAILALALADLGREREALGLALVALALHLPRYRRSVTNYALLRVRRGPAQVLPRPLPSAALETQKPHTLRCGVLCFSTL